MLDSTACAFCHAPDPDDVLHEEDWPPMAVCGDEEACHARYLRTLRDHEPQGEAVRLFTPAPAQLEGQSFLQL